MEFTKSNTIIEMVRKPRHKKGVCDEIEIKVDFAFSAVKLIKLVCIAVI